MEFKDIIKALRCYSEMVEAPSQKFNSSIIATDSTDADFENIICEYIDALNEIKRIKNRNKRYCLVYRALGYEEWQVGKILGMSQQNVNYHIQWLRKFFSRTQSVQHNPAK